MTMPLLASAAPSTQFLHGFIGEDSGTVMIDVAQITGAQMLPSAEERQIGFGAPWSLGRLRVSRSARNEQRTFGGGAPTWTTRSSGPGPSRRTMGKKLPNKGQAASRDGDLPPSLHSEDRV